MELIWVWFLSVVLGINTKYIKGEITEPKGYYVTLFVMLLCVVFLQITYNSKDMNKPVIVREASGIVDVSNMFKYVEESEIEHSNLGINLD